MCTGHSACPTPTLTAITMTGSPATPSSSRPESCGATTPARPIAPSSVEARALALESLLVEKGLLTSEEVDRIVSMYEHDIGPMLGAKVVARAWVDEAYKQRLLEDGPAAVKELGISYPAGTQLVVVENQPDVHNVIVCTLCSCYPWPVLGLPPTWYKSPPYRSRMVREPRTVLE